MKQRTLAIPSTYMWKVVVELQVMVNDAENAVVRLYQMFHRSRSLLRYLFDCVYRLLLDPDPLREEVRHLVVSPREHGGGG